MKPPVRGCAAVVAAAIPDAMLLRKQKQKNMGALTFFLCVYKRRWIILFFLQNKHNINAVF
jgi:hypothetical protein